MNIAVHFILWKLKLSKAWTWYTEKECAALEKYAAGKKHLAEIGCWQGVNTSRIRRVMDPQGILYAVDPYPKGRLGFNAAELIAHHETDRVRNGRIQWLKKTDLEAAAMLGEQNQPPFDFIFSDSLNTYEGSAATWNAWKPLLGKNGIYIIANSCATPQKPIENAGSVRFLRDKVLKDSSFEYLETAGCFTILKKIACI